jgi:uncharacterized protein
VRGFLSRWWWALLSVLVGLGFWRLQLDVDVLNLLPPDLPTVQGLKLYQEHFSNARELIITVRAPSGEQAERFAGALAGRLRQATNLVDRVSWQAPWMEQPAQAAELVAYLWFNQPPETFASLTNLLAPEHRAATLNDARQTLTTSLSPLDIARRAFDPYDLLNLPALANFSGLSADQAQNMFGSADGTFRLIFVQAHSELTGYRACADWLHAVRQLVLQVQANQPGAQEFKVRYTGRPAFVAEIAGSMQRDLTGSITGTALIIAVLFWLAHRRWLPMLWLLALLALILAATVGLGGLLLGSISVVSLGFAAVLLGLAVDYAVVHYQEALAHPELSVPAIRRAIAPSILWAALTTITAFLTLNLGGLPGLAQLGSLVALGVALAALVMVLVFLPPLFPQRRHAQTDAPPPPWWSFFVPPKPPTADVACGEQGRAGSFVLWGTGLLIVFLGCVLAVKHPQLDKTGNALRPQHTEAEVALEEITAAVGIPQDPLWLIASGKDEHEVYERLHFAEGRLSEAVSNHWISGYMLPTPLWPRPEYQQANRALAGWLGGQGNELRAAALQAGFYTNALFLTDQFLDSWSHAAQSRSVVWPTNEMSRWLLNRFVARNTNQWLVLGLVYPATNGVSEASLAELSGAMQKEQICLSGWSLLGSTTLARVRARLWPMVLPMVALVLASLWFAFRRPGEILLGLSVLGLSGLCLLATMALAGWSWNLMNLMGVPLILGTGVDYGLFIQLALRRHRGDTGLVHRSIGRALLLCGGTAIAGFGSLAWSGNAGMAGLGKVCAVGIAANMLISIYLLPAWWRRLYADKGQGPAAPAPRLAKPSSLYRAWSWRLGLTLTRKLPPALLERLCLLAGEIYCRTNRQRRAVVQRNLLPVVHGDSRQARKATRALFRQFALKLLDLWRYENGIPVRVAADAQGGFDILQKAVHRGRGVLLLTPHLGNWELGGPFLKQHGIPLLVITQAEPDGGLTDLRRDSRARWGIETLVIGNDAFAFVEVIKRLQSGAVIALLVDRPPPPSAVPVELFGQTFPASIAAAELARASGCALLGVTVVREAQGYVAEIMPEFHYDRAALGTRDGRRELTQQILRAFEPHIQQYPEQWFHFVPVWPEKAPNPE